MSATAPTPQAAPPLAKSTYISWGEFDLQLMKSAVYRPGLSENKKTQTVTNVKTYNTTTPNSDLEPVTLSVLYSTTLWAAFRAKKESGESSLWETSDGFAAMAHISKMEEISADIEGPIEEMKITWEFDSSTGTGT